LYSSSKVQQRQPHEELSLGGAEQDARDVVDLAVVGAAGRVEPLQLVDDDVGGNGVLLPARSLRVVAGGEPVGAPLKPLPEPADLHQYRVRKQARVGGLISEYHLVA
jgi:hypothetical protein